MDSDELCRECGMDSIEVYDYYQVCSNCGLEEPLIKHENYPSNNVYKVKTEKRNNRELYFQSLLDDSIRKYKFKLSNIQYELILHKFKELKKKMKLQSLYLSPKFLVHRLLLEHGYKSDNGIKLHNTIAKNEAIYKNLNLI